MPFQTKDALVLEQELRFLTGANSDRSRAGRRNRVFHFRVPYFRFLPRLAVANARRRLLKSSGSFVLEGEDLLPIALHVHDHPAVRGCGLQRGVVRLGVSELARSIVMVDHQLKRRARMTLAIG